MQRLFRVVTLAKPFGRPESKTLNLETQRDGAATKTPHRRGRREKRQAGGCFSESKSSQAAKTFRISTTEALSTEIRRKRKQMGYSASSGEAMLFRTTDWRLGP